MPNWSSNTIIISGKKEDIIDIFRKIKTKDKYIKDDFEKYLTKKQEDLTLRSWFPMPYTFKKTNTTNCITSSNFFNSNISYAKEKQRWERVKKYQIKKYGTYGWFNYNCQELGTKWNSPLNIDNWEEDHDIFTIYLSCETAWTSPKNWFKKMCSLNSSDLFWELRSYEGAGLFNFRISYVDGEYEFEEFLD